MNGIAGGERSLFEHEAGTPGKGFARRGYLHPVLEAFEERDAQFFFQLPDLQAESGLCDMQPFGRAREVKILRYRQKIAKLSQFHAAIISKQTRFWISIENKTVFACPCGGGLYSQAALTYAPQFGDIAHLGHVELLSPDVAASAQFFTRIIGFQETARDGDSIFFRGWGDYEFCTLKVTAAAAAGLGHVGMRVRSQAVLEQMARSLTDLGIAGGWADGDLHHGQTFRCLSPDGHVVELYFETKKFEATPELVSRYKNMPQRRPSAITPLRLDHLNLLTSDVPATRKFFESMLGMKLTEQIIFDDGSEMGAWLTATQKSYDIAMTRDNAGRRGRLHHVTYFMETREDVLKAADILADSGVFIETGPHKHSIGQTFFLYCYEPGGNRFELASGGYSIFDPDWKPVVWSERERAMGQAWGLKTIESFHTYGTPPVAGEAEEERLLEER